MFRFDTFLAKYDTVGMLLWVTQSNGSSIETGNRVALDASGNSYVTGAFEGSATFGLGESNQTTSVSLIFEKGVLRFLFF